MSLTTLVAFNIHCLIYLVNVVEVYGGLVFKSNHSFGNTLPSHYEKFNAGC